MHIYDEIFFDYIESGSLASADEIIPILIDTLSPRSILDVGCGRGAWCSKWIEHGIQDTYGVDGEYVSKDKLKFLNEHFITKNLASSFNLGRKYDLVVSLEVAEHIPEVDSDMFIHNLVQHGKVILFSAATPAIDHLLFAVQIWAV
ncbi:class I SAM-dependent methyltransferase [Maridesulfovibrio zosterae]|uniref:class I SAM-dependent methyltransferase n=1 Tax=Maridesulfovibrio zosterae TaxID=82171 RepID=UPI0003FE4CA3|nr:class I SAM-dependent methyltransferase [Maridesulfovibrio zosterae]